MPGYVTRRLLYSAILFWIVTVITFAIIQQAPGGPAALANPDLTREQIQTLRGVMGLDDPIPVQYGRWLGSLVRGDLGISFNEGRPVRAMIAERLPNTLVLSSVALVLAVTLGMGLGIASAARRDSWIDTAASALGVMCRPC
jgi:peptide/nickel transport system permease protein